MTGFLDKSAPSVEAEYSRYLDGDILGKLITKNFLINRIGYSEDNVILPVGRYGDAEAKYDTNGIVEQDPGDGYLIEANHKITFEIKCARINIANRYLGQEAENWGFTNILKSPSKAEKKYDILIAIGVLVLGLEDMRYWDYLKNIQDKYRSEGRKVLLDAKPHQSEYLSICSFFIIPFGEIPTNFFRLTIPRISKSKYAKYWAWGDDVDECIKVWNYALNKAMQNDNMR